MLYLLTIIIAILQLTLVNVISIGNIKPDLLLIFIVFIALKKGPWKAAAVAVLAGFLKDTFGGLGVYVNTLTMPLYAILTGIAKEKFYFIKESFLVEFLAVMAVCALDSIVMIFYFSNWDYPPTFFTLIVYIAIPAVLYTSLVAIPLFSIFRNSLFFERGRP